MKDYHSMCSLPEEIPEEARGGFKIFKVSCGYSFDKSYHTSHYYVKDPAGQFIKASSKLGDIPKSFRDIEEASIFAGRMYKELLDKENEG